MLKIDRNEKSSSATSTPFVSFSMYKGVSEYLKYQNTWYQNTWSIKHLEYQNLQQTYGIVLT